ncbi:MAG: flagellar basal body P-ring protein FlgI [Desulfobia sp.]
MKRPAILITVMLVIFQINQAGAVRLKDLASVREVRGNQLIGYGLVVGLDGTGDGRGSPFTTRAMVNMLKKLDVHVNGDDVKSNNVAGVIVSAILPPFSKRGQTIDITLSALGDASSLKGGTLMATPLKGLNNKVYAIAQGPVSIGGFEVKAGSPDTVQENHENVARIPGGATVERQVPVSFAGDKNITYNLDNPDFTTAARTVRAINGFLGGKYASASDGGTVKVTVPEEYQNNEIALLADLENVDISPDRPARIIIDERTGTVVMGGNVRINPVAVAHGNLSVQVKEEITGRNKEHRLVALDTGVNLADLVRALNSIGVAPRDLIAVLQSIKAAGALQAELKII